MKVYELLRKNFAWTKETYARRTLIPLYGYAPDPTLGDLPSVFGANCAVDNPKAYCWCLAGAVHYVYPMLDLDEQDLILQKLADSIKVHFPDRWVRGNDHEDTVIRFNDHPETTKGDVIAVAMYADV